MSSCSLGTPMSNRPSPDVIRRSQGTSPDVIRRSQGTQIKPDKRILTPEGRLKSFDEMGISTKTVIAVTNIRVNLDAFYNYVPIVDYTPQEKRRGRKKRITIETPVHQLPFGSIIMVQRRRDFRGTILKNKSRKNNTYFLHSITIVMSLRHNKFVNVKVSANGKFQITGCKETSHYEDTIIALYDNLCRINDYTGEQSFYLVEDDGKTRITQPSGIHPVKAIFNTVMQNMDFNIGFPICRNRLDTFINQNTDFCSIFEGSINTEVNIKVPALQTTETELEQLIYTPATQIIERKKVPYECYCSFLHEKERRKETRKERYHTYLVFASGSIIMSSRGPDMQRVFNDFIQILLQNRAHFEDKSLQPAT